MLEILPIRLLNDEDSLIFGSLNVKLGKLARIGFSVASGIVITPPDIHLKTVLEHFDFGSKEVFEQSLELVKKEINSISIPDILVNETKEQKKFFLNGEKFSSIKLLWFALLKIWLEEIKNRIWSDGFLPGISQGLETQIVTFVKKIESNGSAFYDPFLQDVQINIKFGSPHPRDLKKIVEIVNSANKKLFIPNEYNWIIDGGVKLAGLKQYTPPLTYVRDASGPMAHQNDRKKSAVKVFLDLSQGLVVEREVDGVYIAAEKIYNLNKPRDSFEDLAFRLVESATTFPDSPILFKLADMSEGMGRVRGALRLLHQKSLLDPILDVIDFARHKKSLKNVHIVIPFVRGVNELLRLKRELAVKKLMRKNSLQLWMEVCTPENIINLEEYLVAGIDGVVLNLDELVSYLNGFDATQEELILYKQEVSGLLKFLEDGLKLLHKSKIPFIVCGSLSSYPKVLEFLIEKGVYGIVVPQYDAHCAHEILYQVEKRMILKRLS